MVATITGNPFITTSGNGLFDTPSSNGLVQGTAYPDPATIWALRRGWLSASETIPMWGGVAIYEDIPGTTGDPRTALGVKVGRAATIAAINGFSVFDQAYAMVNNPQSPVPLAATYGQVMSYRMGSGARIAVACDPGLVSLFGSAISTQVSWDVTNQILIPYLGTLTISSGTYNNTTGVVTLTMSAPITFSPGDTIIVSGLSGSGNYALLAGTYTALTGTTGSTVVYNPGAGIGASAISGGSLTLGGGASTALACQVLEVQGTNCATVVRDPTTGFVTWNYNGSCAVIQI